MNSFVILEPEYMSGIAAITLNSPSNRNALSVDMLNAITSHFWIVTKRIKLKGSIN